MAIEERDKNQLSLPPSFEASCVHGPTVWEGRNAFILLSHGRICIDPGHPLGHLLGGFFPLLTENGHVYQLWPESSMSAKGSDC